MSTREKKKFHQYGEDSLIQAVQAVKNGAKLRETCKKYGVPKSTVQDRIQGKVPETCKRMGPDPILSIENEIKLTNWLSKLSACGFPVKKDELLTSVQKIVNAEKLKTPFKDGRPGQKWYSGFLRRHPEIILKNAESLEKYRAQLTEEYIRCWFTELKYFLQKSNSLDILDDPSRILNADESGFRLCPKTGKVLGLRGQNVYIVKHGNEKENLTVLVTMTADGRLCPPVVVFPYVKPPKAVVESMPPHWILGKSDSGWMRSDVFFEYVANGFNDWLSREGIHRPVLFLVDGHRSHMSLELSRFCDENSIILYALPPNATHLLQPADVSVFKPLKEYWRQEVRNWQTENVNKVVTKVDFCPIFEKVLKHPNIPKNIRNGFKACGLYPFNPDAVDYSKCVQDKLETLNKNAEVEEEITKEDICSTEKVLMKLKPSLSENGIDVNFILALVKSLQGNQNQLDESVFSQEDLDKMEFIISDSVVEDNATIGSVNAVTKADSKTSSIIVLQNITLNEELGTFSKNLEGNEKVKLSSSQEQGASSNMTTVSQKVVESIDPSEKALEKLEPIRTSSYADDFSNKDSDGASISNIGFSTGGGSFEKHLVYPLPLEKKTTSKYKREKLPSAISSEAWRKHYSDKAREKEEKENAKKKRKLDSVKKKEAKNVMKGQSSVLTSKDQNVKQKCETCEEELDSETEEENEKNVGCDLCPRWFHLGCTKFTGMTYAEVSSKDFICDFCED